MTLASTGAITGGAPHRERVAAGSGRPVAIARKHPGPKGARAGPLDAGKSEPEHFIEFAERIPGWCVVVGLVGTGQEIHTGEEGGLGQWRRAIEGSPNPSAWTVHGPPALRHIFERSPITTDWTAALSLDTQIRYHLSQRLPDFVEALLERGSSGDAAPIATELYKGGHRIYVTRDLLAAKQHASELYSNRADARYGLLASSKDKDLPRFGVDNTLVLLPSRHGRHRVLRPGPRARPRHRRLGLRLRPPRRPLVDRALRQDPLRQRSPPPAPKRLPRPPDTRPRRDGHLRSRGRVVRRDV